MYRSFLPFLAIVLGSLHVNGQNLTLTASLPTKTAKYEELRWPIVLSNTGIVDAERFHVHAYLSLDDVYDPSVDRLFALDYVHLIEAGRLINIDLLTYSVDANPGTYSLILVADGYEEVVETDESDNIFIQPGFVVEPSQIDLTFSSLDIPVTNVGIGDVLEIDFSIANIGSSSTGGAIWTTFFLSNDNTYDVSDIFIGSYHGFLTEEKTQTSAELLLPDLPPGTYYLIGKADGPTHADRRNFEMYTEPNETNNFTYVSVNLSAPDIDLTGGNIDYAYIHQISPYESFYTLNGLFTVRNNGTTSAGNFTYQCYLSQDLLVDSSDQPIGFPGRSYQRVGQGETISLSLPSNNFIPRSWETQFLLIHINPNNAIPETETNNNVLSYQLEIPPPVYFYVDLTSANIANDIFANDSQFIVNLEYTNNSPGDYQHSDWLTYTLQNATGQQIPLQFTYPFLSVPQGQKSSYNHIVNITGTIPAGTYTLTVRSSRNELSFPVNVKNGYVVNGTVMGEDGGELNAGKMFLYRKNLDGKYRYHNSLTLASSNTYSFDINRDDHILYFIPDPGLHPDYVPTIYDKALIIADATLIKDSDLTLSFSVLKINPIDPGGRVINGEVTLPESEGGRLRNGVEDVSVILLDESGKIVGLDYCDAGGIFQFRDLPSGQYSIIIGGVGDNITLEPITIDISTYDASVNIDVAGDDMIVDKKFLQGLILQPIIGKKYGDADFVPSVTSLTNQSILLESSNPDVATIVDGKIRILKAGSTFISASQQGHADFNDAFVQQELTISRADQIINFPIIEEKTLDDPAFALEASTNFQLPVIFTSDNEAVATVHENTVEIVGVGETEIIATQPGNENILAAPPISRILRVNAVTSLDELPELIFYPNPTPGLIHVNAQLTIIRVEAISSTGISKKIPYSEKVIDLGELSPGIYLLHISAREGSKRVRVVKE